MFIDTHCHLNFKSFENDWRETTDRAVKAGVKKMIVVGADLPTSRRAVELAQEHEALFAAVGVHPHHARGLATTHIQTVAEELKMLAGQPKVVAVGEIGLDYHVPKKSKYPEDLLPISEELKTIQRKLFQAQLSLAQELKLPVILHSREAKDEVLSLVGGLRGVFHCFGGSKGYLKRIIEAGFYVGFDGDITYIPDRAGVAAAAPLERLLLETDSPFLTPSPRRGERNEPVGVMDIAQKQAEMRSISLESVGQQTTINAIQLFGLGVS